MTQTMNQNNDQTGDFQFVEQDEDFRLTWNAWSASRKEAIDLACLYNIYQASPQLDYEPVSCGRCQSILCPTSVIDYGSFTWTCNFCGGRNMLPKELTNDGNFDINNPLPEMMDQNSSIQYLLNRNTSFPPAFVLVIDVCTYDQERHDLMIRNVKQVLEALPDECLVGVIQFGTNIELLCFNDDKVIKTTYQFSGDFEYKKEDLCNLDDIRNFLVKKEDHYEEIVAQLDALRQDPFPVMDGYKSLRCTGAALGFSTSLVEGPFTDCPVKHILFTQGPCTHGPGKISPIEISSTEKIDFEKARVYYSGIAERMNTSGHSVDIIAATIADFGVKQLKELTNLTGGTIVMGQDFEEDIIVRSLNELYKHDGDGAIDMGLNVRCQVKTSPNLSFNGFLGEGKALGAGWKVGSVNPGTNLTLLLSSNERSKPGNFGFVQIITQYQTTNRRVITKVTTFSRMFTNDRNQIESSFDQEASCVFQARQLCLKNYENVYDLESAIDKHLIRFTKKYGVVNKNNYPPLNLPDSMSYYVNFMFFFRRSFLVQKDGISSDESAYFKTLLYKLSTEDALKIIKPSLMSFHYQGDILPVELDTQSLLPDTILVLDSFHNVLLWYGMDVATWIAQGLQDQPEFVFFKTILQEAKNYANALLLNRLPASQFKESAAGKSQERILLTHINPNAGGNLNTQKIDFERFYETLCKFIVRDE